VDGMVGGLEDAVGLVGGLGLTCAWSRPPYRGALRGGKCLPLRSSAAVSCLWRAAAHALDVRPLITIGRN